MVESTAATQKPEMSWFERVPKVELHLHLEGAIPHDALWELVQKYPLLFDSNCDIITLSSIRQQISHHRCSHCSK